MDAIFACKREQMPIRIEYTGMVPSAPFRPMYAPRIRQNALLARPLARPPFWAGPLCSACPLAPPVCPFGRPSGAAPFRPPRPRRPGFHPHSLTRPPAPCRVRAPWGVARAPPRRTPTVRRVAGARRVPPLARHLRPRTHRTVAFAQTAGTLKWSGNTPCCSPSAGPAPRRARVLFSSLTHHFSQLCVINTIYHRQNELSTFL